MTRQDWMSLADVALVPAANAQSPRATLVAPDSLEVSQGTVTTTVPGTLIGGALPGPLIEGVFAVALAQLRQAPSYVLFAGYDAESDPTGVRRAYEALGSLGRQPAPFLCLPTAGESVTLDGAGALPVYHVYTDLPVLAAMRLARATTAQIRIPPVRDEGELLLYVLTGHQLHRRLTLLQKCDVVATLCAPPWSYAQAQVAAHLARDEETNETPSQSYVARLIQAARQPQAIRELLAVEVLKLSHVRYLAERVADERERILVARYVAQERLSVSRLVTLLNGLYPYSGDPTLALRDEGECVALIDPLLDSTAAMRLTPPPPPAPYLGGGTTFMAASLMRVRAYARRYQPGVVVHASADPRKVTVATHSLDGLRDWLEDQHARPVPVAMLEETLLGVLAAVHGALAEEGLLTSDGRLSPVVASAVGGVHRA